VTRFVEIERKEENQELKTKEKALTVLETRYRRLFESAKDGILILDAETGKDYGCESIFNCTFRLLRRAVQRKSNLWNWIF
jgi:PAS domain-containing protein